MNSKKYGIAQNRERVFMISIIDENAVFTFPEEKELTTKLGDLLEPVVADKYFVSSKLIEYFSSMKNRNGLIRGLGFRPRSKSDEYAWTITTCPGSRANDTFIIEPIPAAVRGRVDEDGTYTNRTDSKRGVVRRDSIPTLKTSPSDIAMVVDDPIDLISLRRLTPRECWRLMGWSDEDIDVAFTAKVSETQLYKMAGNSIVVNCVTEIFKNMREIKK